MTGRGGEELRLGDFLRLRRARVAPADVGLPTGPRRRVGGLRREELAQLAGISVEYYQRLEQGRSGGPSPEVVDALARALGLDEVERAHLRALAAPARGRRAPAATRPDAVRPELARLLRMLGPVPALVLTDRFDLLAANSLAECLFGRPTNLARYLFLDPSSRNRYPEWDEVAASTADGLRLTAGRYPSDRELATLIADLSAASPAFRVHWGRGDVTLRTSGRKVVRHPEVGTLTLHYENFVPVGEPRQRLLTLTPAPGSADEAALQLLAAAARRPDAQ